MAKNAIISTSYKAIIGNPLAYNPPIDLIVIGPLWESRLPAVKSHQRKLAG